MALEIEYWHWLVVGMILIIAEIFVPSFTLFWFGLGAIAVAVLLLLFPDMNPVWQMFTWAVSSSVLTFLWFKFFRAWMPDRTKAGAGREAIIGESGIVVRLPVDKIHGTVRFTTPVLGSDEWPFICKDEVSVGDRVYITDVSGNTLIVEKRSPE